MLRSMHDLEDYAIGATDGPIGHVKDVYFDDDAWVIRYLVVSTGSWLANRQVLISPISISEPHWPERLLDVAISKEQIRHSPDIDTHKPVSRQHERDLMSYYGYPYYWGSVGMWGNGLFPYDLRVDDDDDKPVDDIHRPHDDPHLRSCKVVIGYHIQATDGEIGHVESLLIDEETWAIRYLVVNTSNWWMGHQVLVSPEWITNVSWATESVYVDMTRATIKGAPSFTSTEALNRDREINLFDYYGRPGYWPQDQSRQFGL